MAHPFPFALPLGHPWSFGNEVSGSAVQQCVEADEQSLLAACSPLNAVLCGPELVSDQVIDGSGIVELYGVTMGAIVLEFALIFRLRTSHSWLRRVERPSSDSTWFLPVYVWGVESMYRLANAMGTDIYHPTRDVINMHGLEEMAHGLMPGGLIMLLVVLVSCIVAENVVRRVGGPARAAQASLPAGVVATILAVQLAWAAYLSAGFES